MKILHLIHPELGLCARQTVTPAKPEFKIRHEWRTKYGGKFFECRIEVVDDLDLKVPFVRPQY